MDPTLRDSLAGFLRDKSSNGLFPIVAYGMEQDEMLLLTTSIPKLPLAMDILDTATDSGYNLGRRVPRDRIERLARENPHVVRLHAARVAGVAADDATEIGRLVSVFGAPFFRRKAFALVDICGFSRLDHPNQLSQLYSLTNVIGSSIRRSDTFCKSLGIYADFGKSSTGDGFYLWHDLVGGNADVATFMLLLCVMTQAEAMRSAGLPMRLKASYVLDSAFMVFDSEQPLDSRFSAVTGVGAATNGAARLIGAARPSQILVMDFERSGQGKELMTPATIVAQANELFRLEGAGAASLTYAPDQLLRVVDKHGEPWYCFNLTGEVPNTSRRDETRVRIGLPPDPAPSISDVAFAAEPARRLTRS